MRNLWKAELLCARSAIAILIYPRTQPHRHVGLVHRAMCSAWSIDVGFHARRCLEMMVHWRKMNGMHVYCDAVLVASNSWKALSIWQANWKFGLSESCDSLATKISNKSNAQHWSEMLDEGMSDTICPLGGNGTGDRTETRPRRLPTQARSPTQMVLPFCSPTVTLQRDRFLEACTCKPKQ